MKNLNKIRYGAHPKNAKTVKDNNQHYKKLLFMVVLSFICMYVLMYSMVNTFSNADPNINQFYMAGLMTMPMIMIEIAKVHSNHRRSEQSWKLDKKNGKGRVKL